MKIIKMKSNKRIIRILELYILAENSINNNIYVWKIKTKNTSEIRFKATLSIA